MNERLSEKIRKETSPVKQNYTMSKVKMIRAMESIIRPKPSSDAGKWNLKISFVFYHAIFTFTTFKNVMAITCPGVKQERAITVHQLTKHT
jgi:hypothetical protein